MLLDEAEANKVDRLNAEIDRLRAALQHEADCVEAAKAEIDRLTRERDEARARCIGETRALVTQREDLASRAAQYMQERNEARAERASMLQAITDPENQPSQYGTVTLAMHEKVKAERDALAKLLLRAGDALVCSGDLMSDGDEWQESHACGRCDERVDRNWVIRTEIRAALAQIEKEK